MTAAGIIQPMRTFEVILTNGSDIYIDVDEVSANAQTIILRDGKQTIVAVFPLEKVISVVDTASEVGDPENEEPEEED